MSLKLRLNLMITALLLLVMLFGTLILISNARDQVQAEIESIGSLATHLLDAETLYFSGLARDRRGIDRLRGLRHLRHIQLEIRDGFGRLIYTNPRDNVGNPRRPAPEWFGRLMSSHLELASVERDIISEGRRIGSVTIVADPSYEIAEVWDDTVDLFSLVLIFFLLVNVMVYWAVSHALQPVSRILAALNELERGNLEARLPAFKMRELSSIAEKFNGMAQALQASIARNHRLSRQLIYMQEEERKSLARDLHDELGQCLTAILTEGAALLKMSDNQFPAARASAQAVVEITHQVMSLLRAMLQRLRPEVLDGLGLRPALSELISNWRQRDPGATCIVKLANNLENLPETVAITAYRVVQECLTNISRHAGARRVRIEVARVPAGATTPERLEVEVEDDGNGFDPEDAGGFGLIGMRERIEGLGGSLDVNSAPGRGARITAILPLAGAAP